MGIIRMIKDNKFIRNMDKLSYCGFKFKYNVKDEIKTRDFESIYEKYGDEIDTLQTQLDIFQKDVFCKQNTQDKIDRKIEKTKANIDQIKEKKGIFAIFNSSYRANKRRLKYLKQWKKQKSKEIKKAYKKIKEKNKNIKGAYKELKHFEKYINKLAKQNSKEIKFITYYNKNKDKIAEIYGNKEVAKIEQCIQDVLDGKQWSYNNMTPKEAYKKLKRDIKRKVKNTETKDDNNTKKADEKEKENKKENEQENETEKENKKENEKETAKEKETTAEQEEGQGEREETEQEEQVDNEDKEDVVKQNNKIIDFTEKKREFQARMKDGVVNDNSKINREVNDNSTKGKNQRQSAVGAEEKDFSQ